MYKEFRKINISYFSGTGGTEKIATLFNSYMIEKNISVEIHSLNKNYIEKSIFFNDNIDLILLLFPVYAFDAPKIIYDWCKLLPPGSNLPIVIISVSGGGEVWINNACRIGIIKKLKKKGYRVMYETMVRMPSNFLKETPEQLSLEIIKELPNKVKTITAEILSGKERYRKPEFCGRIFTFLFKLEKITIWQFGKSLKINSKCNKCNLCINNCPTNNIMWDKTKIKFKYNCEGCLKCVYNCPYKAIYSKLFSFIILKNGYSIRRIEEKINQIIQPGCL